MINSIISLCRSPCPAMTSQKLHSEYRSTYRWHEYTPSHEVIKKPPEPAGMPVVPSSGPINEDVPDSRARVPHSPTIPTHTEYQLQFAWPRSNESTPRHEQNGVPKKSKSMGAIQRAADEQQRPHHIYEEIQPVTKGNSRSLDELHGEDKAQMEARDKGERIKRRQYKSEYRKKFRPFSAYQYMDGKWMKLKEADGQPWYTEVAEMRKKAGEYKSRGWESSLTPEHMADIYKKQLMLMEHISRRSSLSALALATPSPRESVRSITKEEKEKENRKSMPTSTRGSPRTPSFRPPGGAPSRPKRDSPKKKADVDKPEARKPPSGRHHLEKTTGGGEGVLICSATRHKLEPAISSDGIFSARSASQGQENQSPKRSGRPQSAAPSVGGWKIHLQEGETRRPRPTSLSTTASRPKSRTASAKRAEEKPSKPKKAAAKHTEVKKEEETENISAETEHAENKEEPEPDIPKPKHDAYERVMKSPPEPTRVRSPEQCMTKSPDPVNWTVPLDTGKTFTVTQKVPEGEAAKVQTPHKIQSPQHTGESRREDCTQLEDQMIGRLGELLTVKGDLTGIDPGDSHDSLGYCSGNDEQDIEHH